VDLRMVTSLLGREPARPIEGQQRPFPIPMQEIAPARSIQ
jgi:hypothetical protein